MSKACDLCRNTALEQVYAPAQAAPVFLCAHCGLLQSAQKSRSNTKNGLKQHLGKSLRAEANLATLRPFLNKHKALRVLDVGAHRGTFALEFKTAYSQAKILAIEPDAKVAANWAGRSGITWLHARFEDTRVEDEGFDLIYTCHTLGQLDSAREALLAHRAALAPGGYILIEVPNVSQIGATEIVDEFFSAKRRYHFSRRTLLHMLKACGLRAIAIADTRDAANLTVVAVKGDEPHLAVGADRQEVEAAASLISAYNATRLQNVSKLSHVARSIDAMAPRKVAVWGAGRLLGHLIENGGLKPQSLAAVVDKNLIRYTNEAHGVRLSPPELLARLKPDIIVVLSKSLSDEICQEAEAQVPGAEIIAYTELLARANAAA
jgi:2-polyprenyl-3-methyl-5-hydroxy-6-metoxy-1,4-benzoquinol methylase